MKNSVAGRPPANPPRQPGSLSFFRRRAAQPISADSFLFRVRVLKEVGKKQASPASITSPAPDLFNLHGPDHQHQGCQAHMRHTNAETTLERYIKSVPQSVR